MPKKISIVIPVYNEGKNISLLFNELEKVFSILRKKYDYEIIFVNDGSFDNTWEIIQKLGENNNRIKGLSFSRNFGHQAALEAGLRAANGVAVAMMDGDMQHPPEIILELIKKWEEGFEIVNTKRLQTGKESWFKRLTSKMFYALINSISDIEIEPGAADFRLLGRKAVDQLNGLPEKDKFFRGLVNWIGFKSTSIEYEAESRKYGKTSYTFRKMLSFARVGITSFSMLPMKIIIAIGSFLFLGGGLLLSAMLYVRWFMDAGFFSGNAILTAFIIVSNGFIIIMIGIVSVYQMTMLRELKNRPTYIIKDTINYE